MKNDSNFLFGDLESFQEVPQERIVFAVGPKLNSGFGSQVGKLFEVAADKLKQLFVNALTRFLGWFAEFGEGDKDFSSGAVVGAVENMESLCFGLFEELEDIQPAAFQEPDVGGIEDIGRHTGGVDNEGGPFFLGGFLGRLSESGLNQEHSLGANLGAEFREAGGRVHEIHELGRMESAEALGVDVLMNTFNRVAVGEMFEEFEHERGGLSSQGKRGSSLIGAVEFLKRSHQRFPIDGCREFEEWVFRVENHVGKGEFREVGLRVVWGVHGSGLLGQSDLGVEFKNLQTRFPPSIVILKRLANQRDLVVLKFAHTSFAGLVDGEVPIRAVFGALMAAAGFLTAGEEIADEAAANNV